MRVFSLEKIWQIFMAIGCGLFITCFGVLLIFVFGEEIITDPTLLVNWVFFIFCLGALLFSIYSLVWAFKEKLIVWQDKFVFIGIFSTRELLFSEVAGFRAGQNYLTIYPLPGKGKNIKISRYFKDSIELEVWLRQSFRDMDIQERRVEELEILKNEDFGENLRVRVYSYINARNAAIMINLLGIAIGISVIVLQNYQEYTFLAAAVYPPLIAITLRYYKGLLRLDTRKSSPYPSIAISYFGCIFGLFINTIITYHILDYSNVWTVATAIALALFLLLVVRSSEFRKPDKQTISMALACIIAAFIYGYSALVNYNCLYDTSSPSRYTAKVLGKRQNGQVPYITIGAWGPVRENEEMDTDDALYNQVQVDGKVDVYLFAGKLGIPWYTVKAP